MGFIQGRRRRRIARRTLGAAILLVLATACGGGPDGPTPPPPAAPTIACPGDMSVSGVTGGGRPITYADPVVTGGSTPVTTSCTPASGATFPIGATGVSCTARDTLSRQATCSFSVTLAATTLSVTRFMAFGDSVTEGQNGRTSFGVRIVDVPNAYPTKLQGMFDFEFPGQGITVSNKGKGSEFIEDAVKRLPTDLSAEHPDSLLILHGYNDLGACPPGGAGSPECATAMSVVVNKLRECIQIANDPKYGVRYVFVSTLTPPGPSGSRRRDGTAIAQTNARIAQMVPSERAVLVDSYAQFIGHEAEYVDNDGLHLRPAGNEVLARAFFDAIKRAVPASLLFRF